MNPTDLAPGSRLGRWKILSVLGRGGMAVVYKAEDEAGRAVAVKVMSRTLGTDPRYLARFKREAELAARVSHPAITTVIEAGEDRGNAFLVLELVLGRSLRARTKTEGALPWREVATLGARVARGLAAIHGAGLIHRDLKPDNILVDDATGQPKLTDFGVARATESANALTRTGELLGTFEYMAPEQADNARVVDASADLYSLGATLYALVAGRVPFSGSGMALVTKHLREVPASPRESAPDMPVELERLILRLLAKDPRERGPGASEVARELDAIARGGERHGSAKVVAGALAALLMAGVLAGVKLVAGPGKPVAVAVPVTSTAVAPPPVPRVAVMRELAPALAGHQGRVVDVAWSPDGRAFISGGADGSVRTWDLATGKDAILAKDLHEVLSVAWSADRDHCLVGLGDGTLKRWNLADASEPGDLKTNLSNGPENIIQDLTPGAPRTACFTGDGSTAVWGHSQGISYQRNTAQWAEMLTTVKNVRRVASGPTRELLVGGDDGLHLVTLVPEGVVTLATKRVVALALSENGKVGLGADGDGNLTPWDVFSRKPRGAAYAAGGPIVAIVLTREGALAVTASRSGKLELRSTDRGETLETIDLAPDAAVALAIAPGGRSFIVGTEKGRLVRYSLPEERAR
jgi:hypothetical protein